MATTKEGTPLLFKCGQCGAGFATVDVYKSHLAAHRGAKSQHYQCEVCQEICGTTAEMKKHAASHMEFECEYCHATFRKPGYLANHVRRLHERPLPMPEETEGQLEIRNANPYKCGIHDMAFPSMTLYKQHLRSHANRYKCDECDTIFNKRDKLEEHWENCRPREVEDEEEEMELQQGATAGQTVLLPEEGSGDVRTVFVCFLCNSEFPDAESCRDHMMTHTDDEIAAGEKKLNNGKSAETTSEPAPAAAEKVPSPIATVPVIKQEKISDQELADVQQIVSLVQQEEVAEEEQEEELIEKKEKKKVSAAKEVSKKVEKAAEKENNTEKDEDDDEDIFPDPPTTKRTRGRPAKNKDKEEEEPVRKSTRRSSDKSGEDSASTSDDSRPRRTRRQRMEDELK